MTDKKRLIDVSERDWLDYAEADLDTAKLLYKKGKFYEIIGNDKKSKVFYNYSLYHLQQSVEKASKAIFRQMAIIFSGMRSLISNDFGKFREVDPYIKNLLNLKPSQIGHKPYSALEEIGKFIKLYKEGEGLLYIESTLESICNYMKQGLNGAISDESQRAHATETIDSTIQNLDQILKETQKRLKEFDVERKNRAIPNNEELKKVIDCLNNFYNRYNLIIEETKKIASMKKIDKLLENLLPKEMMKNLSMKKIDTLIDITLRGFYLFNINFLGSLLLWEYLYPFNNIRYPEFQPDESVYKCIPELQNHISTIIKSLRELAQMFDMEQVRFMSQLQFYTPWRHK